jgi:hypothetical protein
MARRRTKRVASRLQHVYELVVSAGCVTTVSVEDALGLRHSEAFYALALLKSSGKVVETLIGRYALWCRDEETAKRVIEELKSEARRLLCSNGKYATPSRILELVESDRQAREVFSRYIPLDKTKKLSYKPQALAFADAVLRELFGEPQFRRYRDRPIYLVTC